MLEEIGGCELKDRHRLNEVDVLWTKPWETVSSFFRPQQLSSGIIVNSIGGLSQQVRCLAITAQGSPLAAAELPTYLL